MFKPDIITNMRIETEDFKNQISQVLIEAGFKKQSNSFYYENDDVLFVITLDKSNYSRLYYIRGGFFLKPLDKENFHYKYYESIHRWYAQFPVYKNFIFFNILSKNTDSIDLESINQEGLSNSLRNLKQQLNILLPSLTKESVENMT